MARDSGVVMSITMTAWMLCTTDFNKQEPTSKQGCITAARRPACWSMQILGDLASFAFMLQDMQPSVYHDNVLLFCDDSLLLVCIFD